MSCSWRDCGMHGFRCRMSLHNAFTKVHNERFIARFLSQSMYQGTQIRSEGTLVPKTGEFGASQFLRARMAATIIGLASRSGWRRIQARSLTSMAPPTISVINPCMTVRVYDLHATLLHAVGTAKYADHAKQNGLEKKMDSPG